MCSKALGINRNFNHRNTVSDGPSYSFNKYWCSVAETAIKTQCLSRGACHLVEGQITHRCIYHKFSKRNIKAKDIEGEPRVQFQMQKTAVSPMRAEHPDGGQSTCKGAFESWWGSHVPDVQAKSRRVAGQSVRSPGPCHGGPVPAMSFRLNSKWD